MNFLAGLSILVTRSEPEAFWLLARLVEDLCPQYYAPNLIGVMVDARVFAQLAGVHVPDVGRWLYIGDQRKILRILVPNLTFLVAFWLFFLAVVKKKKI
jgi:hypothetical protein